MSKLLDIGQKVEYLYKGVWQKGIVHGVKTHENELGIVTRLAYLIDTGKDVYKNEHKYNTRDKEVAARANALWQKGEYYTFHEAVLAVNEHKDLPQGQDKVEVFRQPEQIEVSQEQLRPA